MQKLIENRDDINEQGLEQQNADAERRDEALDQALVDKQGAIDVADARQQKAAGEASKRRNDAYAKAQAAQTKTLADAETDRLAAINSAAATRKTRLAEIYKDEQDALKSMWAKWPTLPAAAVGLVAAVVTARVVVVAQAVAIRHLTQTTGGRAILAAHGQALAVRPLINIPRLLALLDSSSGMASPG